MIHKNAAVEPIDFGLYQLLSRLIVLTLEFYLTIYGIDSLKLHCNLERCLYDIRVPVQLAKHMYNEYVRWNEKGRTDLSSIKGFTVSPCSTCI